MVFAWRNSLCKLSLVFKLAPRASPPSSPMSLFSRFRCLVPLVCRASAKTLAPEVPMFRPPKSHTTSAAKTAAMRCSVSRSWSLRCSRSSKARLMNRQQFIFSTKTFRYGRISLKSCLSSVSSASCHSALAAMALPLYRARLKLFPNAGIAAARTGSNSKNVSAICTPGTTKFKAATKNDPPSTSKNKTDMNAWGTFSMSKWWRLLFVTCL
mmetsp:Transcript_22480/g.49211  ORF Transcript_22480/g.49211 Transcript_22480/m.49211 type:complete len:211 (-) Transcript_22480:112-744(-)